MNKFFINIVAIILAIILPLTIIFFNKDKIIAHYASVPYSLKHDGLESDLERGKIIIFGSSELTSNTHKFIPQNYFNKDLKLPLRANGHAGHQCLAILAQLATYSSAQIDTNARVVVFLSPGWFTGHDSKGTSIPKFLEYMNNRMMYELYFKSKVSNHYKELIGDYISKNESKIKRISVIYKYAAMYRVINNYFPIISKYFKEMIPTGFLYQDVSEDKIFYKKPELDYASLKKEALAIAKPSTNNSFGIYNEYYTKYIKQKVLSGKFPFTVATPPNKANNQEYKDFINLLNLLQDYKIKPLFIMQDLNPYAYVKNRESMEPLLKSIKEEILSRGYGYLDMWTYKKEDYEMGSLTDIMHTGELGWVKVNQKIIEHFMKNKGDKQ